MASSSMKYKTREDAKKARELDEARKAGIAPPETDAETGQAINPHIPQYMTSAPWYLNQEKPSLKHQKDWRVTNKLADKWYARGAKGKANVKFKKGACENCGSTTHKTKDCLERPRKVPAKYSNEDLARDDVIEEVQFNSWAHKRDTYKGYNADDYKEVVERYEKMNAARQELLRKEEAAKRYAEGSNGEAHPGSTNREDEDRLGEEQQAEFTKVEKAVRTTGGGATGTVRNLRIREDTAKYLLNLDPKSAHYDPKSRSMRADPNPDKAPHEKTFAGDNALRQGGEFDHWMQVTQYTVMEAEKGSSSHLQAAPTQAVLAHEAFKRKKAQLAEQSKADVEAKYGNAAAGKPDEELLLPSSEAYVEYDHTGKLVRGQEHVASSRYEEDLFPLDHTSVWGSFWKDGKWGYACCKSFTRNSMCLGHKAEAVIATNAANMAANAERIHSERIAHNSAALDTSQNHAGTAKAVTNLQTSSAIWGTEGSLTEKLDEEKVQSALKRLRDAEGSGPGDISGCREAAEYHGLGGATVTPEEMEAYKRFRTRAADPVSGMGKASSRKRMDGYEWV